MDDPARLRQSVRNLLELDFDTLCSATARRYLTGRAGGSPSS
jgi:hypothetical protein